MTPFGMKDALQMIVPVQIVNGCEGNHHLRVNNNFTAV